MILAFPIPVLWRACAATLWLLLCTREILLIVRGHKGCERFRIEHNGSMKVWAPDGCCLPATLQAGSVVLTRVAWLRFESASGRQFAELMWAKNAQDEDWRRLRVILRHLGAGR
jgi:hypothetical protein